jgi:hypothetical protein
MSGMPRSLVPGGPQNIGQLARFPVAGQQWAQALEQLAALHRVAAASRGADMPGGRVTDHEKNKWNFE